MFLAAGGATAWQLAVLHGAVMIASLLLLVRSALHIRRNQALSSEEKITWVLLALFVGFFALPVYWFVIARRPPETDGPTACTAAA
jgi:hypothetical protein